MPTVNFQMVSKSQGGRWEGGSGWGTHVYPWLIHVNVWQKPPQYCKAISLQLKFKKCYYGFSNDNKFIYWSR